MASIPGWTTRLTDTVACGLNGQRVSVVDSPLTITGDITMSASFLLPTARLTNLDKLADRAIDYRVNQSPRGLVVTVRSKDSDQASRILQTRKR